MGMGGGDGAQKAAQRSEAERDARVQKTTGQINAIYDSPAREGQIQQYGKDLFSYLQSDLDKKNTNAQRDLKFSLARSGLTGGRQQIDAGQLLGEEYQGGLREATRRAQGGMADLRSADQQARLQLTQLAQQGLTGSEAYIRANQAMQAALGSQRAADTAQGVGDIFGSVLQAKTASEERKAKQRADELYTQTYTPFYGRQ